MVCVDAGVRRCIPILLGLLADHMENVNIHDINTNVCLTCIAARGQLETLPKTLFRIPNHKDYQQED